MQPNFRRFLPIILIAFFLLILLPSLLRKHSSTGTTPATLSQQTISAMNLVDRAELGYKAAHGHYTGHLSDLLDLNHAIGTALAAGVAVSLDASSDGQGYFGEVGSSVITLVRARQGLKTITHGCLVVKSGSGVACPAPPAKAGSASTSTATTTTTGSTTSSG